MKNTITYTLNLMLRNLWTYTYIYIYIYIYYRYINSYIQHYENAYEVIKCEKITNSCLNMNTCIDNTYIVAEIMHICTGQQVDLLMYLQNSKQLYTLKYR